MNCRFCNSPLTERFIDLGEQPPANRYLSEAQLADPRNEPFFPLDVYVCSRCFLVQLADVNKAEDIFTAEYPYYSSYSAGWVEHARRYVEAMRARLDLDGDSFVVEIASNDGYLLQHFVAAGVPCLGIDPAENCAAAAKEKGVETRVDFFGLDTAKAVVAERGAADLALGNNVLAHVPDINDFVAGLHAILKPAGVATMEFPHVAQMVRNTQFDTIYDEHFSYLSLGTVATVFGKHGLRVFDVDELPTHGGSLRVHACRADYGAYPETPAVRGVLAEEKAMHLDRLDGYRGFDDRARAIRRDFLDFVAAEKAKGGRIAAFGAAAKGNTFLNYCGVGADVIDFVVDDTPAKQGRFLPQSHIPIVDRAALRERKPDVIVILPWNFAAEIKKILEPTREWGARFVTCIPSLRVD